MNKLIDAQVKKWEKAFERKLTPTERTIFIWGLVYGIEYAAKISHDKEWECLCCGEETTGDEPCKCMRDSIKPSQTTGEKNV